MPAYFHSNIDMGSSSLTTLLSRTGPTTNPLSPTTQNDILTILQQEQEHALSLLSLSPLLSSLFVSYASRAGPRGSQSTTAFADSEEWKTLQDTITTLRGENDQLRTEVREMVRKLEMSEASQEMLRSQISSLNAADTTHQEDAKALRTELVEAKERHDRVVADLEAEKAALKVQISDLEGQRGQLRDTAVKQQIRITKLERPTIDGTSPLRIPSSPPPRADPVPPLPSSPLPDSPVSPFHHSLPPVPSPRSSYRPSCISPSPNGVVGLRPHPMARGGLVPGRHKSSIHDLRSEATLSGWFADGD